MTLDEKLKNLPDKSGVYIMRDASGAIIYIGKAVILKNRVRQYFNRSEKQAKVQAMVDNIADFDYIVTLSEKDALALEANLIKKHKPYYNILLKDDKASPYIKIDLRQEYPCIEVTRKYKRADGVRYFGPYFNGLRVREIVEIVRSAYKIRTCQKQLKSRVRPCLNHQIGLCDAPCTRNIAPEDYRKNVDRVMHFLSGHEESAETLLTQRMAQAAEVEEFERAMRYRDQLAMIARLKERTVANLGNAENLDAFAYATTGLSSAVAVVIVRARKLIGVKHFAAGNASESAADALSSFIMQYYAPGSNNEIPHEICVDRDTGDALKEALSVLAGKQVSVIKPERGSRRRILKTAEENAAEYLKKTQTKQQLQEEMTLTAAKRLAEMLNIRSARRMECYDISNISGVDKVASGVVFIDGSPSKSDYRRYRIKTVEGSDDFASMAEVIGRRLARAADDEKFSELPDLIVIDGGKGQLSSAQESMHAAGYDIPMISLAERDEEIFTVHSSEPIVLNKSDYVLRLLQRIRDEAHRFAVTYHRTLRSKRYLSELESVAGIGKTRLNALYKAFRSIDDIKAATEDELAAVKGMTRAAAESVYRYFNP